ncbi:response regulator transcription factor [Streptomyces sp. NPDC049590]|uniref:helix-turn-helix transcriptional regulator n=1 Tax=Streptomyces sp. NPDC049590 TaxID=3154834 RepID=UPI00342A3BC5
MNGWDIAAAAPGAVAEEVRVLVADHDPISRHVLGGVLRATRGLSVVGAVDARQPTSRWPLDRVDVVVLAVGPHEDPVPAVRALHGRRVRVLLMGTEWSRGRLTGALAAGAGGCLVKDARLNGLGSAAHAVAAGHTVICAHLHEVYTPRRTAPGAPASAGGSAREPGRLLALLTRRERDVLRVLAEGVSTAEAAARLGVSSATIKSHVSHALTKLGARNRVEAVLMMQRAALYDGGVPDDEVRLARAS